MLTLVPSTDHGLVTKTIPFDFSNPPMDPEKLVNEMLTIMANERGIGLAANQVGLPYSLFVVHGDPFACFNPKIVDVSEELELLDEGCLTYPGLYVKVKRPKHIRFRFTTIKGDVETKKYTGMTARVIQHEMDHLEGNLFYNAATKYHKDQAFRKFLKYQRHPERFKKTDILRT